MVCHVFLKRGEKARVDNQVPQTTGEAIKYAQKILKGEVFPYQNYPPWAVVLTNNAGTRTVWVDYNDNQS